MTDLTDFYVDDRQQWENHNSSGSTKARDFIKQGEDEVQAKVDLKARTAYDATDLGMSGPPEGEYDYKADYQDGNTLTPDENGGITLNNKKFNPGVSTVAGVDVGSGKVYTDHWKDEHGDIAKGRKALSEGQFNTLTGATYDQTDGLFNVANGMMKEKATFKEFQDEVVGPWNNAQMAMAWHAAEFAHQTMIDIDTQGRRYYDETREKYDQYEGVLHTIPAGGYTEETLSLDKDWIRGSRRMAEFLFGEGATTDKSDEQVAEASKFFISQTRNNIDMTMLWANRIVQENNPELARTWLALDAQYDAMDISGASIKRFAIAQMNIVNLATFGGGVLITNMGKFATQAGIKNAIRAVAMGTAYDTALSGAAGVGENLSRQNIEIAADIGKEEIDIGEASFMGAVNAGAGVLIGGSINSATNKTVRDYATGKAGKAVEFMGQNMQDMGMPGHVPGSPASQRGSVGFPATGDEQVQSSFKLQQLLGGLKDGAKPITVRENIKAAVNKGLITQQEVKWSGIDDQLNYLEREGMTTSRAGLLKIIEHNTPKPELVNVNKTSYAGYTLMTNKNFNEMDMGASYDPSGDMDKAKIGSGYRERMLIIRGEIGEGQDYRSSHFGDAQNDQLTPDDSMIGHSRVEGATLGEDEGKMILEIQSDYHKAGQQLGYQKEGELLKYKGGDLSGEAIPASPNRILFDVAVENGIDPYEKNAFSKIWPFLDKEFQQELLQDTPELMPFGKDWDAMGMRLEIMDSINEGDKFVAWPASADQVNYIEKWGDVIIEGPEGGPFGGIVKRATTDRNKAMKKMGLEVEQVDMPQYKGMKQQGSDADFETLQETVDQYLAERNMRLDSDESGDSMIVRSYPEGLPDAHLATREEIEAGEILEHVDVGESWEWMENLLGGDTGDDDMSTIFNMIRLTDEVKKRFRKEGMNMYGAAPVAAVATGEAIKETPERKRGPNGRFTK